MNVETTYAHFLELTNSPEAAATLVLAAVTVKGQPKSVLTPPELAEELGTTPETVIGWINTGKLRAANVGKGKLRARYRIKRTDVDAFLDGPEPRKPDGSFKLYRA